MTITLYKRNARHLYISLGVLCFILISGIFALVKISDPSSYCHVSAPAQIYVFSMYNVAMTINYFISTLTQKESGYKKSICSFESRRIRLIIIL